MAELASWIGGGIFLCLFFIGFALFLIALTHDDELVKLVRDWLMRDREKG